MKFLLDENLPPTWVATFEEAGFEAFSWLYSGKVGAPDNEIWTHALDSGCVVVSKDLDFSRMLAMKQTRLPSVIQLRVENPVPKLWAKRLMNVITDHQDSLQSGCLISLNERTHRVRILPL